MKTRDMLEYLKQFPASSEVSVITTNPEDRLAYPLKGIATISDMGNPVLVVMIGKGEDMDEGDRKCTGVQMELKFEQ